MSLQVLRAVGLRQGVDQGTFTTIASLIDEQWRLISSMAEDADEAAADPELWETALLACTCMRDNATSLHNSELYQALRSLAFVPALRVGCLYTP